MAPYQSINFINKIGSPLTMTKCGKQWCLLPVLPILIVVYYYFLKNTEITTIKVLMDAQSHHSYESVMARLKTSAILLDANIYEKCPRWFEIAITMKKCISDNVASEADLWNKIHIIINNCGANLVQNALHLEYLQNADDTKLVVPPAYPDMELKCLTLGIGNDIEAEKKLAKLSPGTKFFGADPIEEDGKVYEAIGAYKQVGVSRNGGKSNASVLINNKYVWRTIETLSFVELLKYFKLDNVDYLLIDIEGAEYQLLQQILSENNEIGAKFCQINVEIHGPLAVYGETTEHFNEIVKLITAQQSPYIPIHIPKPGTHHRFFLINFADLNCIEKFLKHWC